MVKASLDAVNVLFRSGAAHVAVVGGQAPRDELEERPRVVGRPAFRKCALHLFIRRNTLRQRAGLRCDLLQRVLVGTGRARDFERAELDAVVLQGGHCAYLALFVPDHGVLLLRVGVLKVLVVEKEVRLLCSTV